MYDLIIVGGGPAGLTAGIYAKRAALNVLLLEKQGIGGQIALTDVIENYPGFSRVTAGELIQKFEEHAKKFELEHRIEEVVNVLASKEKKIVESDYGANKKRYETKSVIIATGTSPKTLGVKGEKELTGRGISYCGTCDGFFFRDKNVLVVGGGDTALTEALFLTKFAKKVFVVHRRDKLRGTKILQERAFANAKIEFIWNTTVAEISGIEKVSAVRLKNQKTGDESEIVVDGVFVFTGVTPNTSMVNVKKDTEGFIITNEKMASSGEGIFAAGDCRAKPLRQISTAVGDGAIAGVSAEKYIAGNL